MNNRQINSTTVLNNPAFINDELQPPPYSSIYPNRINNYSNLETSKVYSVAPLVSTNNNNEQRVGGGGGGVGGLNLNHFEIQLDSPQHTNAVPHLNTTNFFQHSQDPISYEELFQSGTNGNNACCTDASIFSNSSTRYLFQNNTNNNNSNTTPVILQPMHNSQHHQTRTNNLAKQLKIHFSKSYLLRHVIFISATSFTLISFQIILMTNHSILSFLGGGIWAGLGNLFTLIISIAAVKYAKLWLLILAIIIHVVCIMFNLGGLVIINCIAATKYSSCSYYPSFESTYDLTDRNNCYTINMKYANIAIILLGATCMIMFVTFFFKLINVFNQSQAVQD